MPETITIVGASARAAAEAARRAGYGVVAGDLFADADLARIAQAHAVDDYPHGLLAVVAGAQAGDWLYCGGLENHPALVDRAAALRPLLGNAGPALCAVRDPLRVSEALARHGIRAPRVAVSARGVPRDRSWLCKPLRSAGGARIAAWDEQAASTADVACYWQERIEGLPCSASFIAASGRAVLLGVTEQLIGQGWLGAGGFRYCGSLGPLALPVAAGDELARLGGVLAAEFALQGLFGVDFILQGERVWPVEVNPRYTASLEVLEQSLGLDTIGLHLAACRGGELPAPPARAGSSWHGKAIWFAERDVHVSPAFFDRCWSARGNHPWSPFADIPAVGTHIAAGEPILTLRSTGSARRTLLAALRGLLLSLPL